MNCQSCGAEIKDDAKFCTFCGASQDDNEDSKEDPLLQDREGKSTEAKDVQTDNSTSSSSKDKANKRQEASSNKSKKKAKQSAKFLLKWLGIYATISAALFIPTLIAGATIGAETPLRYRFCALGIIALAGVAPYTILVVALMAAGESERGRMWGKVKRVKNKKPAVFKGCVAAFTIALLAALFTLTSCPHSQWNPATCTEPKTCSTCGTTEGSALGHNWTDATCTNPKTCSRCSATEGEAKGHVPGEWVKEEPNYADASITIAQKCSVCGATTDSKKEKISSFAGDQAFTMPASDFVKRIDKAYSSISGCSLKAESGLMSNYITMSLDVKDGGKKVAAAGFVCKGSDNSLLSLSMSGSENQFWQVLFSFSNSSKSSDYAAETMYALIQACDPSLSKDEAHKIGSEVIDNYKSLGGSKGMGQTTKNGITYSLANSSGWMVSAKIG